MNAKEEKQIIAITGNIGSGKSTVMAMLEKRGYKTLSADEFTDSAYEIAREKLVEAFGEEILQNGEISRKNLGRIAFLSKDNLEKLNQIMHPVIFQLIFNACSDEKICFVEVPLLFESGMQKYFSKVWLVKASNQDKIQRASLRDGISREEISKRLSFQINDEEKTSKVHIIIENDGNVENLKKKVENAIESVKN